MPTILYEDTDVVVIDKPCGMLVHADSEEGAGETVVSWFLAHVPSAKGVGEPGTLQDGTPIERSGVVHRLDRETSGVMVLAKNQDAFLSLKEQFKSRRIHKEYRAFVHGTFGEKWGTIDRPIGRSAKDFRLRSAQRGARGVLRPAVTDWELVGQNDEYAYLRLLPKTGRTHQIRVHLKAINHAIVCDALYAPNQPCGLGFGRLALHAHVLGFELPGGETRRFMAPLPQVFVDAVDAMEEAPEEEA